MSEDVFSHLSGSEVESLFEAEVRILEDKNGMQHRSRIADL